ncbi:MAG TPA: M1 family metallopeptidase, partial [Telluria sp.]
AHILAQVTVLPVPLPAIDGGVALARPDAGAVRLPSAPGAWGGARTGLEPTLSDRVVNYAIDATLDPVKHTVSGRERLTWRNRSDVAVRSVYVHMYMNAFEGRGSTFYTEGRNSQSGFRGDTEGRDGQWGHIALRSVTQGGVKVASAFVQPDNGPASDHTVMRFDLPAPVAAGASTTLDIDFVTQLPRVVARTGYVGTFHLVAQWYPKMAVLELAGERGATAPRWNAHEFHQQAEFYADFGNFDVRLTVPKNYVVGATGEAQGAPVEKDGMLTHHYVQGDVHDFAWTADSRTAAPLKDSWTGPGSPAVAIAVLYPPDMAASAAPALKAAKDALTYFSNTLGPYPYKTLTVVIPPHNAGEAAGMEYPTFFTSIGQEQVEPNTIEEFEQRMTTIHEFGHGYFYGILASNEFEEPLLDEGLNEYWNHRMLRALNEKVHLGTPFLQSIGFNPAVNGFDGERAGAPREEPADPLGANAWDRLQGIGPVYARGATVMRDLEERIGKEATERAFKEYYKRWKFRHPSIADLRESLAEASGRRAEVEAVFAQQVYATAKVDDRVDAFSSTEELPQPGSREVKGAWVEENSEAVDTRIEREREAWTRANPKAAKGTGPYPFRTSVTLRRRGAAVPQTVLVRFADGSTETATWNDDARWKRLVWVKPVKAVSVELDPQRKHYLDVNKLDDSRTLEANGDASRRWAGDFSAIVTFLLSLIASV